MEKKISVIIADDSVLMRLLIKDVLASDPEIEILKMVSNGKDLVEECLRTNPDVALVDLNMGEFDGLYAIKRIMKEKPLPIVILSAVGNSDMSKVFEGLNYGAVDYINKPIQNHTDFSTIKAGIVQKVKNAYQAKAGSAQVSAAKRINEKHSFDEYLRYDIIVIGSSTGGPPAIEHVLSQLPENIMVPILIAQHMPPNFVPAFASRLDSQFPLRVKMALKDDELEPGMVYIAPGSRNMIVRRNEKGKVVIDFTSEMFKEFNHPSVDGLMLSVASVYKSRTIGVLLTGMGRDGAAGMCAIKNSGGYTIVQDKETCVVFGMPGTAVEYGCSHAEVPIQEMGMFLVSCLS